MVFASVIFLLVFLPLFLLVYHAVPHRYKNGVALGASLVFYIWGAPLFFWLLIPLLIANFYIVKYMEAAVHKTTLRKTLLWTSLGINLGVLIYFKYANFFVENLNLLLSQVHAPAVPWVEVLLPIGISFFTFQSITYTLDVYWGKHRALEKVQDFLLYILLFPQLIAGPIIRFNTIADEIKDRRQNYTMDFKLQGVYTFCIGLAKKVLIANQVGAQVDVLFAATPDLSTPLAWLGIVAYSIQIYFDFSGYSDMAIGLGKILGFRFPENFKNPYTSESITDFWRKWHITLGAFMRDYLYIPLGGNRSRYEYRNYANLVIVFLLSGLWHGAAWTFVIWGAWHGLFLMLERAFLAKWLTNLPRLFRVLYQYVVVLVGWVFFRADTFEVAAQFLHTMFVPTQLQGFVFETDKSFYTFLIIGLFFSFLVLTRLGRKMEHFFFYKDYSTRQHVAMFCFSLVLMVLSLSYIVTTDFNPFIYFRF